MRHTRGDARGGTVNAQVLQHKLLLLVLLGSRRLAGQQTLLRNVVCLLLCQQLMAWWRYGQGVGRRNG
uniref:Putative secreted peptide n=1 Tax=Anopheles braziliensis TaxID=58242 RepID=A0A2M3ZSG4_9DIPT